jgi:hypothetical protein
MPLLNTYAFADLLGFVLTKDGGHIDDRTH